MDGYEAYEEIFESTDRLEEKGPLFLPQAAEEPLVSVDFEDPAIASLPRVLLMGPRRAGKSSIQVRNKVTDTTVMIASASEDSFWLLFLRGSYFRKCLHTKLCFD